jgi:putative ABC transport system substrate-binding protein
MPRAAPARVKRWLVVVAAALLAVPPRAAAQPPARIHSIGVLDGVEETSNADNLRAFRTRLVELGYVEGQSFVIHYRSAAGRFERVPDLAKELVGLNVDVIVTRGEPAVIAAKRATSTIPIVMASSGHPVISGVVASLARPGGNITGFYVMAPPELGGERLRLLREAAPALSRVGMFWNPGDLYPGPIVKDTEKVAATLGVQLRHLEVRHPEGFAAGFEAALVERIDALIAVEDLLMVTERARILEFAAASRLPAIYGLREFVDAGGLMSYGTDRRDLFRRAAEYVDRILKGASPAELPVLPPTRFELAINLKTARTLGLTIPPSLLRRADHVVE